MLTPHSDKFTAYVKMSALGVHAAGEWMCEVFWLI